MTASFLAKPAEGREVVAAICQRHRVAVSFVLSTSRVHALGAIRREIAVELYARKWSSPQIARLLRRDHSSVLYMLKTGEEREQALMDRKIASASRRAA